jgi:hypothetical protein
MTFFWMRLSLLSFWKRKGDDDAGFDGPSQDNIGKDAPNHGSSSTSALMDVDKPQGGNSGSHGKSVTFGLLEGSEAPCIAVTPFNLNLSTPRGKEIVEAVRSVSPWLPKGASLPGRCMLQRPSPSSPRLLPGAPALGQPASPAVGSRAASPPATPGQVPTDDAQALTPISPLIVGRSATPAGGGRTAGSPVTPGRVLGVGAQASVPSTPLIVGRAESPSIVAPDGL